MKKLLNFLTCFLFIYTCTSFCTTSLNFIVWPLAARVITIVFTVLLYNGTQAIKFINEVTDDIKNTNRKINNN